MRQLQAAQPSTFRPGPHHGDLDLDGSHNCSKHAEGRRPCIAGAGRYLSSSEPARAPAAFYGDGSTYAIGPATLSERRGGLPSFSIAERRA
jgi:hypothetical protein